MLTENLALSLFEFQDSFPLKMIELPYYVWVALGVIVGINILLEKYYRALAIS